MPLNSPRPLSLLRTASILRNDLCHVTYFNSHVIKLHVILGVRIQICEGFNETLLSLQKVLSSQVELWVALLEASF